MRPLNPKLSGFAAAVAVVVALASLHAQSSPPPPLTPDDLFDQNSVQDIQLTVNQTPQNFVANAAAGRINGFELELVARPARWFTANASLG